MKTINSITKSRLEYLYFEKGLLQKEIAKILDCSQSTVSDLFKKHGIITRIPNINLDFFRTPSHDFYYVLGLWASDGHVGDGNRLELTMTDGDVIKKVAELIGYKLPIKKRNIANYKTQYRINFRNKEVCKIFESYGVTPKKTKTLQFPDIKEEYVRDFIRGVFDGDGSVMVGKRKDGYDYQTISIVGGSRDFIESIQEVIRKHTGIEGNSITKLKGQNTYVYRTAKKEDVIKFYEWLYKDDAFGMKRKKEKFKEILAREVA